MKIPALLLFVFLLAGSFAGCQASCPPATAAKAEECRQRIERDCPLSQEVSTCDAYVQCVQELEGTCK